MKKVNQLFVLLLSCTILACNDDDDGVNPTIISDTVSPVIAIVKPAANDSSLVFDVLEIFAEITDDRQLNKVQVFLTDPSGSNLLLSTYTIDAYVSKRNLTIRESHLIPKHAATGQYTISVEASDSGKNVTKNTASINLHASDLSSKAFVKPFINTFFNSSFLQTLDWFGYNYYDHGLAFDDVWLSTLLYLMVNTDNEFSISELEWAKFITDFNIKNQSWAKWDENNNEKLDEDEFYEGITRLNWFKEWDTNQDKVVMGEELAAGVFSRWDDNNDSVLRKEEYLEKSYTYLYSY